MNTTIKNYKKEKKEMFQHKVVLVSGMLKIEIRSYYMLDVDDIMDYLSKIVTTNSIDQIPFN